VAVKAKVIKHTLLLDGEGRVALEGGEPQEIGSEWTPEHLVLAGLARCSVASLRHYARKQGVDVDARALVDSRITKRDDGSYGFVSLEVAMDVTLTPAPQELAPLLEQAEWGCFIGASLKPKPTYTWRVNGEEVR
jgi:uncharacterized OsmC-like protein